MRYSVFFIGLMAAVVNADRHRLCACQVASDGAIDDAKTQEVVMNSNGQLIYSNYFWKRSDGAHFGGRYFHVLEGKKEWAGNKASDDGWIGGDEANGKCLNAGAADTTCFNARDWQRCGEGADGCFNSYGSTDGNGNIV
ncbi:m6 [Fusarium mexicanum]|uniref:M6 n=1 Tax=Fusarium mexicanum TaxID=751941 RepID=A0A8H5MJ84_9HYPO|nr:m6 [Fusarium mexicanum]